MKSTHESTDNFGQLGQKKAPEPVKPAEVWRNTDTPHIQQNSDGKLRTNIPSPTWPTF